MIKTYRMWRLLRIAERELFRDPIKNKVKGNETSAPEINSEFCKLRKVSGKHYTSMEGVKALIMAEKKGYMKVTPRAAGKHIVGITGEGLSYTSVSNLINELAGALSNLPQLLTLIISIVAIIVSIMALHTK